MALVTTTVTPTERITPFTGISEVQRERSGIARAEVVYSAYGLWPATAAGDNRSISFSFTLNPDYGYTLMDSNAAFIKSANDRNNMEATGVMEITTDLGPGASQKESQWYPYRNLASRMDPSASTTIGSIVAAEYNTLYPITGSNSIMTFNMDIKPTALLYPFPGVNSIDCTAMWGEQLTEQAVIAYRFYTRFMQYDITQGYNYAVNSPALMR
jgi:hypothetical protein